MSDDGASQLMTSAEAFAHALQWSQVCYGEAPRARFGHAACSVGTTMMVVGGVEGPTQRPREKSEKRPATAVDIARLSMDPSPAWQGTGILEYIPNASANFVAADDGDGGDAPGDAAGGLSPTSTRNGSPARSRKGGSAAGSAARAATVALSQHCVASGEGYVFVVGGWLSDQLRHNRSLLVVAHDGDVLEDAQLQRYTAPPREAGAAAPPSPHGVTFAAAAVYRGNLYVFGGCCDTPTNHLWDIPVGGGAWHCTTAISSTPANRSSHVMLATPSGLLVHGGRTEGGTVFDDVHVYNTETATWSKVGAHATGTAPAPRYGHAAVVHKAKVYMFGGAGGDHQTLNDLHVFDMTDPAAPVWTEVVIPGDAPSPRAYHSLTLLSGTVCLFGGNTAGNVADHAPVANNDLWMFDLPGHDIFDAESMGEAGTDNEEEEEPEP